MNCSENKCKLCGGKAKLYYYANGYGIYRCVNCSLVQVDISSSQEHAQYDTAYFDNNKYRDLTALKLEHKRRISILSKYAHARSRVIDYGCATGEFVEYASNIFNISGCDISSDAIRIAKEKYNSISDRLYTTDVFFKKNEKFDVIVLWDVIEHIENPLILIKQISDRINEGGYLIMSTPDIGAVFARVLRSHWPFMTPPEHLVFFSKKSTNYLAKIIGYDICQWYARGKWANVGFILYKFNRVSKIKIPQVIINCFKKGWLSNLRVYVPTHDIQYVVMRKPEKRNNE